MHIEGSWITAANKLANAWLEWNEMRISRNKIAELESITVSDVAKVLF
jgi:hypothetical protein